MVVYSRFEEVYVSGQHPSDDGFGKTKRESLSLGNLKGGSTPNRSSRLFFTMLGEPYITYIYITMIQDSRHLPESAATSTCTRKR